MSDSVTTEYNNIDWYATTWEGNRRRQIEHWAHLSLDEIFAAQEEMAEFAEQMADHTSDSRNNPPAQGDRG